MGCINVIVGVPGVGKTATARNYCREQPNTDDHPVTRALQRHGCLLELAEELGIDYTRANKRGIIPCHPPSPDGKARTGDC